MALQTRYSLGLGAYRLDYRLVGRDNGFACFRQKSGLVDKPSYNLPKHQILFSDRSDLITTWV